VSLTGAGYRAESILLRARVRGEDNRCARIYELGKTESFRTALNRLAGRADEIAQDGNIGPVGADAPGIHGQAEALGEIEIDAGIIQFGQAETLRGQHAIYARRVHRPRRTVTLPGAARQFVKLLPIAFVPSRHSILYYVLLTALDAQPSQKVRLIAAKHGLRGVQLPQSPSYSYTPQQTGQDIFLVCCFKHVTGRIVSRNNSAKAGQGASSSPARLAVLLRQPRRESQVARILHTFSRASHWEYAQRGLRSNRDSNQSLWVGRLRAEKVRDNLHSLWHRASA